MNAEKTALREMRRARLHVQALEGSAPGPPPRLSPEMELALADRLQRLAQEMPGHGRVALAYMPEEVKAQAREK